MGLEVSLILALAEGNFHTRNTKKATFGTSRKMSQNRTLRRQFMLLYAFYICGNAIVSAASHGITLFPQRDATWNSQYPRTELAGIGEVW